MLRSARKTAVVASRQAASAARSGRRLAIAVARLSGSAKKQSGTAIATKATIEAPNVEHLLNRYPTFDLNARDTNLHASPRQALGPQPGDEAILTLSGGVDSSVAAYLALEKDGLVPSQTVFMRNWNSLEEQEGFEPGAGGSQGCQWMRDWDVVQQMAKWLGIEAELVDLSAEYWNTVFSPSLDIWSAGLTPNPDVMCNTHIKFGELLRRLDAQGSLGASDLTSSFGRRQTRKWLVTGHYAGLEYYLPSSASADAQSPIVHGRLMRAVDMNKDQSYFLSAVDALQLGRAHFPLAKIPKTDVRKIARTLGMPTAESEESMGLCFVGERHRRDASRAVEARLPQQTNGRTAANPGFAGFLGEYIHARPGPIVMAEGKRVGTHNGLHSLTIGQGARLGGVQHKYYVAAKDAESNAMLVVPGGTHPWLQCQGLNVSNFQLIGDMAAEGALIGGTEADIGSFPLAAQIRHRSAAVACRAEWIETSAEDATRALRVVFMDPVLSVAEGQVCALYHDRQCLGSGVISQVDTGAPSDRSWVPKEV